VHAITCQAKERFAFTKDLSAAKLFNPSLSKKMQITVFFLPPNLKELLRFTLPCVKKGWAVSCLFYTKYKISAVSQDLWKVYEFTLNSGIVTYVQLVITTPTTTAELERRFSILKAVKTF
jgi:hypothetical protein